MGGGGGGEGEGEEEEECDFSCLHTIYQNHLCALLFHSEQMQRVGEWEGEGEGEGEGEEEEE